MTTLILIRHGQTASNSAGPNGRMSGWTDLPLTALGEQQVERLRERFQHEPPLDAVYSSPLRRARATAAGLGSASRTPVRLEAALREIHCGEVEGRPIADVEREHATLWARNLRQEDDDFRWPGGESYRELRERSLAALRHIAAVHGGARVAIVTHCGVITQIVGALHGSRPAQWAVFRPQNTSLTMLRWAGSQAELVTFDDHRHLEELTPHAHANTHPPSG